MLICNQVNYLLCDPSCPHVGPHDVDEEWWATLCNEETSQCVLRDDRPLVRCVEVEWKSAVELSKSGKE